MESEPVLLPEDNLVQVLDKGFVRLVSYDASDEAICSAARVSYQKGNKKAQSDANLIRYLIRHFHETPLEMTFFKFHVKAPIFVFRQWHRHRIGISINEMSARYSELPEECYIPDVERIQGQSTTNKQGSDDMQLELAESFQENIELAQKDAFEDYHHFLKSGMAREMARINLPVSTYSEMYWSCNLRSLFHFCGLRLHEHAQYEVRVYAQAMFDLVKPLVPMACEAFQDYRLNACTFSAQEMEHIRRVFEEVRNQGLLPVCNLGEDFDQHTSLSKREKDEFRAKLGL